MLHVRHSIDAPSSPFSAADAIEAGTLVASDGSGPFEPLAIALVRNDAVRDELGIKTPSTAAWSRSRFFALGAAVLPFAAVFSIEASQKGPGLVAYAAIALFVGIESLAKTPRHPAIAAAGMAAVAVRLALAASLVCGRAPAWVFVSMALAITSAAVLARAPSRSRVALEAMGKLGITRSQAFAASSPDAPADVARPLALAAGFPIALFLAKKAGLPVDREGFVAIGYVAASAFFVRKVIELYPFPVTPLPRIGKGIGAGLALGAAVLVGGAAFFDAGTAIAKCAGKLDRDAVTTIAREAAAAKAILAHLKSTPWTIFAAVVVMPIAEERIVRDLFQRVLVRRYGAAYGLFASAIASGLLHPSPLPLLPWEAAALGLACGVAWLEGGLIAACIVHVAWTAFLLAQS